MKLVKVDVNCKFCEEQSIVLISPQSDSEVVYCPLCGTVIDDVEEELDE